MKQLFNWICKKEKNNHTKEREERERPNEPYCITKEIIREVFDIVIELQVRDCSSIRVNSDYIEYSWNDLCERVIKLLRKTELKDEQ